MSILQKLTDNKIGVGLAVVHWFIVGSITALSLSGFLKSSDEFYNEPALKFFLITAIFIIDLPAIIPAALLWLPVYVFADNETNVFYGFAFTSFFTITFQWLFIGKALYNTFSANGAKPISLSLND